jgi:hypothetical protein
LGRLGFLSRHRQPAARQCGNDASRRAAFPFRQFLGRLKYVVFDIQSRSHNVMLLHQYIKVKRIN